jgi:hypothetical protein
MTEEHRQYEQQRAVPPQTRVEPVHGAPAPRLEEQVDPTQVKTIR